MHGQVRELMTNYGKIDVLWLDYSYPNPAGTDMIGETWEATKLVRMVRELQPEIMLDNRLECGGHGFGSLMTAHPNEFSGDFVSPEQIVPPNGLFNELGERVVWESGVTINNNWGYCQLDKNFKPADMVVKKLVECVSKGGNLLLNFGPGSPGRYSRGMRADPGRGRPVDAPQRREHPRLRLRGAGKAGIRPHHAQWQ